jgi:hypothetical protein
MMGAVGASRLGRSMFEGGNRVKEFSIKDPPIIKKFKSRPLKFKSPKYLSNGHQIKLLITLFLGTVAKSRPQTYTRRFLVS